MTIEFHQYMCDNLKKPVEGNLRTKMACHSGVRNTKEFEEITRKPHFKPFKHQNTNLADNQKIEPHFLVLTCSSAVLSCLTWCGFNYTSLIMGNSSLDQRLLTDILIPELTILYSFISDIVHVHNLPNMQMGIVPCVI